MQEVQDVDAFSIIESSVCVRHSAVRVHMPHMPHVDNVSHGDCFQVWLEDYSFAHTCPIPGGNRPGTAAVSEHWIPNEFHNPAGSFENVRMAPTQMISSSDTTIRKPFNTSDNDFPGKWPTMRPPSSSDALNELRSSLTRLKSDLGTFSGVNSPFDNIATLKSTVPGQSQFLYTITHFSMRCFICRHLNTFFPGGDWVGYEEEKARKNLTRSRTQLPPKYLTFT